MSGGTSFSTIGGVVTRGETYAKMLHHIQELRNQMAVMSHLHKTEGNQMDDLLAKGWLGMEEMMHKIEHQITSLAMSKLQ